MPVTPIGNWLARMTWLKALALSLISGAVLAQPLEFAKIEGWAQDNHQAAFSAFLVSCAKSDPSQEPLNLALKGVCEKAVAFKGKPRAFFESHFTPHLTSNEGFVTAYYEPEILGSRVKNAIYKYPLYKKPGDLVSEKPNPQFDARSKAGRMVDGKLEPYYTRGDIENGAIASQKLELIYLKDENDGFFLSIQGSGRVLLQDGGVFRAGYDAHNGHPYIPIGRVLVERNIADKAIVTMDYLRSYLREDYVRAKELRAQNKSYVFFRELTELLPHQGPIGGQGVPVTPWRTLAVDKTRFVYGTPIFISGNLPLLDMQAGAPFQRLMIAQDTGSAIRGAARGDLYLGSGFEAGVMAGNIKHKITWITLLPIGYKP